MKIKLDHGVSIEYEVHGNPDSPAIVLIRGLGTQLIDWPASLISGLVDSGLRVVVFDNRDVGLSQKFEGVPDLRLVAKSEQVPPYTLVDMACDVVGLLDTLGVERAHIVGISMGGMIAQVLAAQWPERVINLFSVMSSSSRRGLPGASPEAAATLNEETEANADRATVVKATVRGLQVCGSPGYPVPEEELRLQAERRFDRHYDPYSAQRQMAAVVATGDRSALLASILVPTLVIHGADDPLIPLAAGQDTADQIPNARIEIIEGMGHDIPNALVPELHSLIVGFIERETSAA